MAEAVGGDQALCRRHRGQAPQVLRADRVPLSLRPGPARGSSPALYRHGHRHPEKAHGGLQRSVPHRI